MKNNLDINSHIDEMDMGILYGFSLFETFMVNKHNQVFLLEKHLDRMLESAACLGIDISISHHDLMDLVNQYIKVNEINNKIMRIMLTAGNKQKNISPSLSFSHRDNIYTTKKIISGCDLRLSTVKKNENSIIVRHKTGNYLENYLLLQDAIKYSFDDVLLLNSKEQITETCKCNIFFVKNNVLYTPEISCGILPGIMRSWIIKDSSRYGLKCVEGKFLLCDILNAEEVFVCNSAMGIMHVKTIEQNTIGSGIGDITYLLQKQLSLNIGIDL